MNRHILKEHSGFFHLMFYLFDWATIVISGIGAHWLYIRSWQLPHSGMIIGVVVLLSALTFPKFGLYRPWRVGSILDELVTIAKAWFFVLFLTFTFLFVSKMGSIYSRGWIGLWSGLGFFSLILERVFLRLILRSIRQRGLNQRIVALVGVPTSMQMLLERITDIPWAGFSVLGYFPIEPNLESSHDLPIPILGNWRDTAAAVQRHEIEEVWIVMPLMEEKLKILLHDLRHEVVGIRFFPDFSEIRMLNHSLSEIAGLPVINLTISPMEGINRYLKEIEDRVLAAIFLMLVSPFMILIAVGIKLSSPGPVFYRQERIGWNGQIFSILKFRTMPVDLESQSVRWGLKGKEPTKFGGFLRKTSLDEFPQFINVLRGEMSIVGPRPERPMFVNKFKDEIPGYMQKHLVKAGITGWAQINGWRGDTDLTKRIEYDLYYIAHWSLWFDLKIILLTALKGFLNNKI